MPQQTTEVTETPPDNPVPQTLKQPVQEQPQTPKITPMEVMLTPSQDPVTNSGNGEQYLWARSGVKVLQWSMSIELLSVHHQDLYLGVKISTNLAFGLKLVDFGVFVNFWCFCQLTKFCK